MLLSVIKDWYSFLDHTFWQSEQTLRAIEVPVSYWARTPREPRNVVQLCNIVVEGCKFSFRRKLSEREGGRGRGLWCGLIAAIKLDMALWGLAQCALCKVQFAMWYVIWLYDALNTLDFHPLHKPRNLTTALWAAPAPVCKNAHDPRPRFPHPHHPLDTQGG